MWHCDTRSSAGCVVSTSHIHDALCRFCVPDNRIWKCQSSAALLGRALASSEWRQHIIWHWQRGWSISKMQRDSVEWCRWATAISTHPRAALQRPTGAAKKLQNEFDDVQYTMWLLIQKLSVGKTFRHYARKVQSWGVPKKSNGEH